MAIKLLFWFPVEVDHRKTRWQPRRVREPEYIYQHRIII
jgi:hypothetical protein